jgi:exodeoxyribonuclease VIII
MKKFLTNDEYHLHSAISKSKLDRINKSELHYLKPQESNADHFTFGQAVHDAILLPDLFASKYIIQPESIKIRRGKEWEAFLEANKEKEILKKDDYDFAILMRDRIMSHPLCSKIFKNGEPEMSYFGNIDGLDVKCKPDYVSKEIIIDLKTTKDASPDGFSRAIGSYRYHVQSAFYLDVCSQVLNTEIKDFLFIAIEKEPPFAVGVYLIDKESIDLGRKHYLQDLKKIKNLDTNKQYSGYNQDTLQVIGLPQYYFYGEMN